MRGRRSFSSHAETGLRYADRRASRMIERVLRSRRTHPASCQHRGSHSSRTRDLRASGMSRRQIERLACSRWPVSSACSQRTIRPRRHARPTSFRRRSSAVASDCVSLLRLYGRLRSRGADRTASCRSTIGDQPAPAASRQRVVSPLAEVTAPAATDLLRRPHRGARAGLPLPGAARGRSRRSTARGTTGSSTSRAVAVTVFARLPRRYRTLRRLLDPRQRVRPGDAACG